MALSLKQKRRLGFGIAMLVAGAVAAALVIVALQDNMLFFYSPSDIAARPPETGRTIRIGGIVAPGSVKRGAGLAVAFAVTDGKHTVPVRYSGVLPDLFREGQGVVALGMRDATGVFMASEILAKHDERYMPREVVDALKRSGRWREGEVQPAPAAAPVTQ
jgi:cytochrome c-type biogenesis protein CcmE